MDTAIHHIMRAIRVADISGESIKDACVRLGIPHDNIDESISELKRQGLAKPDGQLTSVARESVRVVLAGGVFDIIHPGHIHTLESAKKLGDVLVVVVATDDTVLRMKGRLPLHTQDQRRRLVESLRVVDACIEGVRGDMFKTVRFVLPDTVALGYDQIHQEKYIAEGCQKINMHIHVARLQSPVPHISSTKIKEEYGPNIHDT